MIPYFCQCIKQNYDKEDRICTQIVFMGFIETTKKKNKVFFKTLIGFSNFSPKNLFFFCRFLVHKVYSNCPFGNGIQRI